MSGEKEGLINGDLDFSDGDVESVEVGGEMIQDKEAPQDLEELKKNAKKRKRNVPKNTRSVCLPVKLLKEADLYVFERKQAGERGYSLSEFVTEAVKRELKRVKRKKF